jgi:two-component system, oxyanion-binding sensor
MTVGLRLGFVPLVDAAPLILAEAMGFAEEEGLRLELETAPSWSALRDRLAQGAVVAAHMLAPVPVALALGLGGPARFEALSVLNLNGNVVGVSAALADRMPAHDLSLVDARAAGMAVLDAAGPVLRIGVPFAFSMHAELVRYWLEGLGRPMPPGLEIVTVPPPLMPDALAAGEIDAFAVGEPRGSGRRHRKRSLRPALAGRRPSRTLPGASCGRSGGRGAGWRPRRTCRWPARSWHGPTG